MWNPRYRRAESSEGFQMSPCLTASSGLLTPPSNYSIDARRGSTASTLSSLGPSTPIYARNPFSDHSYTSVAAIDQCQDQSIEALSMVYPFKTPGSEGTSYDNWTTLSQSDGLDHTLPMRMQHGFVSHSSLVQSPMATYGGMDNQTSSVPVSCTNSFSSTPYTDFGSQLNNDTDNVHSSEPIWSSYQYALAHMMAPTMAPTEALLGGEYVQVGTVSPDTDMGHYDEVDMPLAPSPQDVVVKQEDSESSADERRVTRSIWISSTGGKSVKKEEQAGVAKKKARKSRSKAITRLHGDRFEIWMDDDVVQIPGTKKWRRNGGGSSKEPHICQMETAGAPCGRKFRRQEHLHRHEKTHSGRKDYSCQLCLTQFNRNDNCWEHYWTHVHRPGKKNGRNTKHSLRRVLTYISDPKHTEKLLNKWRKEVGYEYDASNDPQIQEDHGEDDDASPAAASDDDSQTSSVMKQEKCKIRCRL